MTERSAEPAPDTSEAVAAYVRLHSGEPAPAFIQRSPANARFASHSMGGYYVVLCFIGSAGDEAGRRALAAAAARADLFNVERAVCFGVSVDRADETRLRSDIPGLSFFWDADGVISKAYGALPHDWTAGAPVRLRRQWVVLDPQQHVHAVVPFRPDGSDATEVMRLIETAPPAGWACGFESTAPVITLSGVFEPDLCDALIAHYRQTGGAASGFMREIDGRTVLVHDTSHKVRSDVLLPEGALKEAVRDRIYRRIKPEIRKVHQFEATRLERYLVGCYSAESGGRFRPHRDNTTPGTAHRRFACSINLNADFEGGELRFPEYGRRTYKPPPGAAVVFSCSLLHEVSPVTRGERFAFLPFLYDDAAAAIREANHATLDLTAQA